MNTRRQFLKKAGRGAVLGTLGFSLGCSANAKPIANNADKQKSKTPNVLFFLLDQLAAGICSYDGGPVPTPNIDRLAKEGVVFTQATCPTPYCSPTRMSAITSLYPHQHGITLNVGWNQKGITLNDVTTEKILWQKGYKTHHYGKWHLEGDDMPYYTDMYRQFPEHLDAMQDVFEKVSRSDPQGYQNWYGMYFPVDIWPPFKAAVDKMDPELWKGKDFAQFTTKMGRLKLPVTQEFDVRVADHAVSTLRSVCNGDQPFMVTCGINAPHDPYVVASPYYEMFDPLKIKLPENRDTLEKRFKNEWSRRNIADIDKPGMNNPSMREFLRIYYALTKLADDQVGRIIKVLEETGELDNTLVIFAADHGDMAGGHGMAWKSTTAFYEEVVRVPLIIRYPKMFRPKNIDMAVDHTDIMPTILDITGETLPTHCQGQSLVDYMTEKKDPAEAYPYKFSERIEGNPSADRKVLPETKGSFMIRGKGWKYIRYPDGGEYMYNLKDDPLELKNVADNPEFSDIKEELQNELKSWLEKTNWQGQSIV
ncbi:Choline-sulfatase [Limihaloglobus sulfuriphilus]|uniref:Choline-sulfatase n=1 Tax=Limihaloglobus sulfuriphilus TaxID=1851148 RepID=A0A1Q2ME81_9BACT|nr:sulfatase-like hydrolase/transferase [Limihaloglobus sulfuriphilus]AQQ71005.1 Choline-sulfatase [Limihaloglobus sulfuriphilus]